MGLRLCWRRRGRRVVEESEDAPQQNLSLLDVAEAVERKARAAVGVCAEAGKGLTLGLTPELRALLEDAAVAKQVHDWKQALHALKGAGRDAVRLGGRHDAAVVCAEPDARDAVDCRCGGAEWAGCADYAGRRCAGREGDDAGA